jgi:uncharacterized protein (DUF58 family)
MPTWDESGVAQAASRLRLGIDARRRTGQGARLGRGPGASLEFHDHRAYEPGDDLRHLDWSVYARTDQLVLRRHRQEVSPRLEVIVDGSASMAVEPAKLALTGAIAALVCQLGESDGIRPRLWWSGSRLVRHDGDWRVGLRQAEANGTAGLEARFGPLLPGADRILISDGLCPGGGAAVVRRLADGAGRCCLLQILTPEELAPTATGAARLEDVEGGAADHVLDAATISAYRARLQRQQDEWRAALAGRGAGVVSLRSDENLATTVRRLLAAGVVEARGASAC